MVSRRPFMPHQAKGYRRSMPLDELPLFWEMRLGKSILSARWLQNKNSPDNLLLCPKEVFPSWSRELRLEGIPHQILRGTSEQKNKQFERARSDGLGWFVTNYESMQSKGKDKKTSSSELARFPWTGVICDESTKIRKATSHITKTALRYLSRAQFKAILSGLANPEGPEDYVTQFLFLYGKFMGAHDFYSWRRRHMLKISHGQWVVKRSSLKGLRLLVHEKGLLLTRKQAGIGSKKIREARHVDIPSKVRKAVLQAESEMELSDRMTTNILEAYTWIARLCGGRFDDKTLQHDAKINELLSLVEGDLRNEPLVVWARYTLELEAIHDTLKRRGWSTAIVYGRTSEGVPVPDYAKEKAVADFQEGKTRILVVQPKSLKMGVDLSRSSTAIFYSNYWDAEIRAQIEDRLIHPLKREPVLLIDLVAVDTPDEAIVEAVRRKRLESSAFNADILNFLQQRRAA